MTRPREKSTAKAGVEPRSAVLEADVLTTRLMARSETDRQTEMFVGWLLNVPATCECVSGTDLLRQYDVLPR